MSTPKERVVELAAEIERRIEATLTHEKHRVAQQERAFQRATGARLVLDALLTADAINPKYLQAFELWREAGGINTLTIAHVDIFPPQLDGYR